MTHRYKLAGFKTSNGYQRWKRAMNAMTRAKVRGQHKLYAKWRRKEGYLYNHRRRLQVVL